MNVTLTNGFTQKTCKGCGVIFFIPDELEKKFKESGGYWYCPNGHQYGYAEPDAVKYKRLYEDSERYRQNAIRQSDMLQADVKALQNALDKCKKPRAKKVTKK